ncbi:MAG: prepilin peptidase [Clostridia bacterium]|nr:MAG: prepilin peptidase [Clostridia bacterium]
MTFFGAVIFFVFGLVVGSFLNVCIWRLPRGESVVFPPSHCPACGRRLAWRDMVPVLSYIFLQGRCRYCGSRISHRYPLVEALTGAAFLFLFYLYGTSSRLVAALVLTCVLEVAAFVDLEHMRIPNGLLLTGAVAGLLVNLLPGSLGWREMALGAVAGAGPLLAVVLASRGGMGGGDVKLAAVAGLYLGWRLALTGLFLGVVAGGVMAVVMLALRRVGRRDPIPFGPFLAVGFWVAMVWGKELLACYLRLTAGR